MVYKKIETVGPDKNQIKEHISEVGWHRGYIFVPIDY